MKHLLFAAYIFSVLYCYLEINAMIDRCIDVFKERHPLIPVGEAPIGKGLRLGIEILAISAIPVMNISLGFFISTMGEEVISEVVNNVEVNHLEEIREAEGLADKLENLDEYF